MLAIFLQNVYPMRGNYIRYMVILWIWFSMIISISFNANFYSVLTTPSYKHKIETVIEAAQKSWRFGFPEIFEPVVRTYSPELMASVIKNHAACSLSFKCLNDTIKSRDLIVAKGNSLTKFYASKYYMDDNGRFLIYALPSPLIQININMIMVKGYPVLERFNQLIMLLKTNGLISKWVKDFSIKAAKQAQIKQARINSLAAGSYISLDKAWLAFIVLLIGCGASFVVFLKEISHKKSTCRKSRFRNLNGRRHRTINKINFIV